MKKLLRFFPFYGKNDVRNSLPSEKTAMGNDNGTVFPYINRSYSVRRVSKRRSENEQAKGENSENFNLVKFCREK